MSLSLLCSECNQKSTTFVSLNKLEEHVVMQHVPLAGLIYKCTFCQPMIHCLTEANYFQHCTKVHPNEGKLKVEFVPSAVKVKAQVKEFMNKCLNYSAAAKRLDQKPIRLNVLLELQCFHCSVRFSTINKLEEHLVLEHCNGQIYKCAGCPAMSSYPTEASILDNWAQHQHDQNSEINIVFSSGARAKRQQIETLLHNCLLLSHPSPWKTERDETGRISQQQPLQPDIIEIEDSPNRKYPNRSAISNKIVSKFAGCSQLSTPSTNFDDDTHFAVKRTLTFQNVTELGENANDCASSSLVGSSSSSLTNESIQASRSSSFLSTITHTTVREHGNKLKCVKTTSKPSNTNRQLARCSAKYSTRAKSVAFLTEKDVRSDDSWAIKRLKNHEGTTFKLFETYSSLKKFERICKPKHLLQKYSGVYSNSKEVNTHYYRCTLFNTTKCPFRVKAIIGKKGDRTCTVYKKKSASHNH